MELTHVVTKFAKLYCILFLELTRQYNLDNINERQNSK